MARVALDPEPRLQAKLTSQAVAFNAPQVLSEGAWLTTDARLRNLGVFSQTRLELTPAGENEYAATLHLNERNGWGGSPWAGLISLLSGVPYQTALPRVVQPRRPGNQFFVVGPLGFPKTACFCVTQLPVEGRADRVVSFFVDARNENWNLSRTFFRIALAGH